MKLNILMRYDINEQTGEITFIGKEEVTVDTAVKASAKTSAKIDENEEPLITLEPNKLVLTKGAVDLMKLTADCRIDVKYKKKDGNSIPVIGMDTFFNSKGNKLSKTNTVSFRGVANSKLSEFGTVFKLKPTDDEGIFYLIGDAKSEDTIDIESELDIDNLDNILNFDFKL